MKPIAIIAIVVCCVAVGAFLALQPDDVRACFFSGATGSCTWTHPGGRSDDAPLYAIAIACAVTVGGILAPGSSLGSWGDTSSRLIWNFGRLIENGAPSAVFVCTPS